LQVLNKDFLLKWAAHAVIVAATITTALDIIPLNKLLFLTGCILWAWVGVQKLKSEKLHQIWLIAKVTEAITNFKKIK
jgi:hypothetical protein